MFIFFNLLLGLMAFFNLFTLATGRYPSVRELSTTLQATEEGRANLHTALAMSALVQIYLIGLIFPLKALSHEVGLGWSVLMIVSVLETIYTARKMNAVVSGDDTTGKFPLHDSPWYMAYQVGFNLAIVGVCVLLVVGANLPQ